MDVYDVTHEEQSARPGDVPEDEAITVPDLSRVFGDDDDDPDPFDPEVDASDPEVASYENPGQEN